MSPDMMVAEYSLRESYLQISTRGLLEAPGRLCVEVKWVVAQSVSDSFDPMDCAWNSPGQNAGVVATLIQGLPNMWGRHAVLSDCLGAGAGLRPEFIARWPSAHLLSRLCLALLQLMGPSE